MKVLPLSDFHFLAPASQQDSFHFHYGNEDNIWKGLLLLFRQWLSFCQCLFESHFIQYYYFTKRRRYDTLGRPGACRRRFVGAGGGTGRPGLTAAGCGGRGAG